MINSASSLPSGARFSSPLMLFRLTTRPRIMRSELCLAQCRCIDDNQFLTFEASTLIHGRLPATVADCAKLQPRHLQPEPMICKARSKGFADTKGLGLGISLSQRNDTSCTSVHRPNK